MKNALEHDRAPWADLGVSRATWSRSAYVVNGRLRHTAEGAVPARAAVCRFPCLILCLADVARVGPCRAPSNQVRRVQLRHVDLHPSLVTWNQRRSRRATIRPRR